MSQEKEELYPISIFKDELKSEDTLVRINAIKRLTTIALALGVEKTRNDLVPFIDRIMS